MSDEKNTSGVPDSPAEQTKAVPVTKPRRRHTAAAPAARETAPVHTSNGGTPFSRVTGNVRPSGQTQTDQSTRPAPSRARVAYAPDPSASTTRRPVQADGYRQVPSVQQTARNGQQPTRPVQTRPAQPVQGREPVRQQPVQPVKKRGRALRVIVILLLILVLAFLGLVAMKGWPPFGGASAGTTATSIETADPSPSQNAAQSPAPVPSASAAPAQLQLEPSAETGAAPCKVVFTMTTNDQVNRVVLFDKDQNPLEDRNTYGTSAAGRLWSVDHTFDKPYEGDVYASAYADDTYIGSSQRIALSIWEPSPLGTPTPAPEPLPSGILGITEERRESETPLKITYTVRTEAGIGAVAVFNAEGVQLEADVSELAASDGDSLTWTLTQTYAEDGVYSIRAQREDGVWLSGEEEVYAESRLEYDELALDVPDTSDDAPVDSRGAMPTITPTETPPIVTQAPLPTPTPDVVLVPVTVELDAGTEETATETEPEPEETPAPTAEPQAEEPARESRRIAPEADASAQPKLIKVVKVYDGKKKLTDFRRAEDDRIDMPDAANYNRKGNTRAGVLTFRGSSFRQNAAVGTVNEPAGMSVLWRAEANRLQYSKGKYYYGIGVGSQPVIVQWAREIRPITNIVDEKKEKTLLREVIVAGEDGFIYFLDLEDGQATRTAINVGYPMHCTPSVSARVHPFMAVGQAYFRIPNTKQQIGLRCYNLLDQKQMLFVNGFDKDYRSAKRPISNLGSFNTSPLYDWNSNVMLFAGSNGLLYEAKLSNIKLNTGEKTFTADISCSIAMATQANKEAANSTAVESSLAAYQGYVFYADNGGYLRCVDANTLTVQWAVATGDAVQSAVALDLDADENLWLYTANTLDNRNKGDAAIRRVNAETGAVDWTLSLNVVKPKNKSYTPGFVASPVIGTGGLGDYVYYTVSGLSATGGDAVFGTKEAVPGALICVEKNTGRIRWAYKLSAYSYSSPVAVYDENGSGWIIQASSDGTLSLLDGQNGTLVYSMTIEGTINGSPAVYDDILVIGTQGKDTSFIYGIKLQGR